MKTFWKVTLIIFLILLILFFIIAGIIGFTIYQVYQLKDKADSFAEEINALQEDCSNAGNLRSSAYELRDEIQSACKNPILKWFADRNLQQDICSQVKSDEYVNSILEEIESSCQLN